MDEEEEVEGISDSEAEGEETEEDSEEALPMGSGGPDMWEAMVQDLESPDIQASQPSPIFGSDEEEVVPAIENPKSETLATASPSTYSDMENKNKRIKELQSMISRTKKEQVSMNFDLYSSSMFSVFQGL